MNYITFQMDLMLSSLLLVFMIDGDIVDRLYLNRSMIMIV